MKKARKTMLPATKHPHVTNPAKSQKFRVHAKGVDGNKSAIRDAGVDTMVPLKAVPSVSKGGGKTPMPTGKKAGMPKAPRKSKVPHSAMEHHPKNVGDIAMLKRTPFR